MRKSKRLSAGQIVLGFFLLFITLTMLVPLLNILAKSFSSPLESPLMGGLTIFPKDVDFINYKIVFSHPILVPALINSIIITVVGTVVNIGLTTTAAYVLSRPS